MSFLGFFETKEQKIARFNKKIAHLNKKSQHLLEKAGELYITQGLHDLLKARIIEDDFSAEKMRADFEGLFPGKSGSVEADGKRIEIGEGEGRAIAASAVFYSANLSRKELRASVFLD